MPTAFRRFAVLLLFAALAALPAAAQQDETWRSWNQPVEPFRIAGNLYYVGASDVTAFLLTGKQGHVLLDGGFAETAPLIRDAVRKLGFRLEDVKILLNSHAHADHAGGLAALKEWTGATLLASVADAPLLAGGGKGDYLFGDKLTFPAVRPDRTITDGETVRLGEIALTAHLTPGHTQGCTTWTTTVEEGGRTYRVVFLGGTKVNPGAKLTGMPSYPRIGTDYERTFATVKTLPVDIFLAAHGAFFDLTAKAASWRAVSEKTAAARRAQSEKAGKAATNPFVDPEGYRRFVERTEREFRDQLAKDRAAAGSR